MNIANEKSFEEVSELIPELNLLIVTANDIETYHVRQSLIPLEGHDDILKVPHHNQTYFIGMFGEYLAIHVQCGSMGSISSAGAILTVSNAVEAWKPLAVLMIGVAMGINEKKQNIGDVLISESIISYENQRLGEKIVQRGLHVSTGQVLLNRFKNVTGWSSSIEKGKTSKKIIGPILSGEKLIDNIEERNKLTATFPSAVGAEMEGAGVYAACKDKNVNEWILVKGICDYGDGNKNVKKDKRQNLAAECATSICHQVFTSKIAFTSIGLKPIKRAEISESISFKLTDMEEEIVTMIELKNNSKIMHTAVQLTVAAFLELNSYQKANVIDRLGLELASINNLSANEMNKEFFLQVKKKNLLPQLWETINQITPFENEKNPFL